MKTWIRELLAETTELLWGQWVALGAYLTGAPFTGSIVDPEALIIATCSLGRGNQRLFDEAMDWVSTNHRLLKTSRLRRFAREFGPETQRVLGAMLETASGHSGETIMPRLVEDLREAGEVSGERVLFWTQRNSFSSNSKAADETFARWGFLRGKPKLKSLSGKPDLENPANMMLKMRANYGVRMRADLATYLFSGRGGNSNQVATKTGYTQPGVYKELKKMREDGLVSSSGEKQDFYWIDRARFSGRLGVPEASPVYFAWSNLYHALYSFFGDWDHNREAYDDAFLAAERIRNLTPGLVLAVRKVGEPLAHIPMPDLELKDPEDYQRQLVDLVDLIVEIVRDRSMRV